MKRFALLVLIALTLAGVTYAAEVRPLGPYTATGVNAAGDLRLGNTCVTSTGGRTYCGLNASHISFYADNTTSLEILYQLALAADNGVLNYVLTSNGDNTFRWASAGEASMVYPGAGVPLSTGSAWGTSYTVGTGANNLVQLNASSQLPAVSAALLTNFPTLNQNTTGNAATATALASNPANCSAGQAPLGIDNTGAVESCWTPGTGDTVTSLPWDNITSKPAVLITGATANRGLVATDNTLGLIETCGPNEILKWNGSAWACASDAQSVGSNPGFDNVQSGSNTSATMTVGTGASLAPVDGGTITASNLSGAYIDWAAPVGTGPYVANKPTIQGQEIVGNVLDNSLNYPPITAIALTAQYIDWDQSSGATSVANRPTINSVVVKGAVLDNVSNYPAGLLRTNGSAASLTSFPTLNQNTTGTAAALGADPTDCTGGQFATGIAASGNLTPGTPAGSGDVVGPSSATDNALVVFDGTTGKLIKNSGFTIGADNTLNVAQSATQAGYVRLYELSGDGTNYIGLQAPDAITDTLTLLYPNENPNANYLKCGAPSGGVSTCDWDTPAGSGDVSGGSTSADGELAAYNGTGGKTLKQSFAAFSGPASSVKTYTLPNANATIVTEGNATGGLIFGDTYPPDAGGEIGYSTDVLQYFGSAAVRTVAALEKANTWTAAQTLGNAGTSVALNFTDTDVTHGVTTFDTTNTYFSIKEFSATKGGAHVTGYSDTTDQEALHLRGVLANDPDTGVPAVRIDAYQANGTGTQAIGATKTAHVISNNDTPLLSILGNGATTITGALTAATFNSGNGAYELRGMAAIDNGAMTDNTYCKYATASGVVCNYSAVAGNPFDQDLNTNDNVVFNSVSTGTSASTAGFVEMFEVSGNGGESVKITAADSLTDNVTITVSSTSVALGALSLATTGTITGGVMILDNVVGPTAAQVYGSWNTITTAGTVTLPAAAPGMSTCIATEGALEITLELDGSDTFVLEGVTMAAGEAIINTTAEAAGDYICVIATSAVKWRVAGKQGTWTQASP